MSQLLKRRVTLLSATSFKRSISVQAKPKARSKTTKPKVVTPDLHQAVSAQDLSTRIRFLPQLVGYERVLQQFGSEVDLVTARESVHLLPFWTVAFLCDVKRGLKHKDEGWVTHGRPRQSYMDIGCSVAAVPNDHWASGLVLIDDLRLLSQRQARDKASSVSSTSSVYDTTQIGWNDFVVSRWDKERVPAFAFSYPRPGGGDEEKMLSSLPQHPSGPYIETWKMNNSPTTYAMPTYRVGYKVDLAGGRTGYVDGYFDLPSHSVVLSKKRGAHLTNYSWSPVHSIRYNARKLFEGFHTTQISREPLLPAYRSAELGEMLVKAMQRNPVDWDDEHILPWNGQERNGMMLETQLDHRIFGRLEAANDIDLPAGKSVQVASEPFRPPEPTSGKPVKPIDMAPPRPARVQRRTQPTSSRGDSPLLHASASTTAQPKVKIPISPRPPPPTLPTVIQVSRIADPKGFYALLGVTPTPEFLDPSNEAMIARLLGEKRRTLALKFHADRGGDSSWEGEMSRINAAYDQIRTYDRRKRYSYSKSK